MSVEVSGGFLQANADNVHTLNALQIFFFYFLGKMTMWRLSFEDGDAGKTGRCGRSTCIPSAGKKNKKAVTLSDFFPFCGLCAVALVVIGVIPFSSAGKVTAESHSVWQPR